MKYVYDLDGTLVDTHEAVRQAYRAAGIEMPDDAWGKPAKDWIPADRLHEIHNRKHGLYLEMLKKFATRLPLLEELELQRTKTINVITGASFHAVTALYASGILPRRVIIHANERTKSQKVHWLAANGWGTYVDDDEEIRRLVTSYTTWQAITPEECLKRITSVYV